MRAHQQDESVSASVALRSWPVHALLDALSEEALPLKDPLIRFQGRTPPAGGEAA